MYVEDVIMSISRFKDVAKLPTNARHRQLYYKERRIMLRKDSFTQCNQRFANNRGTLSSTGENITITISTNSDLIVIIISKI